MTAEVAPSVGGCQKWLFFNFTLSTKALLDWAALNQKVEWIALAPKMNHHQVKLE